MKVMFVVDIYAPAPEGHFSNEIGGVFTKEVEVPFCPSSNTLIVLSGFPFGFIVSHARWVEGKPYTEVHLKRPTEKTCRKFLEEIDELRKFGWK